MSISNNLSKEISDVEQVDELSAELKTNTNKLDAIVDGCPRKDGGEQFDCDRYHEAVFYALQILETLKEIKHCQSQNE